MSNFDSKRNRVMKNLDQQTEEAFDPIVVSERKVSDILKNKNIVSDLFDANRVRGESTGYRDLDNAVGGIRNQSCIIIGGATGMGKSIFSLNILMNMAKSGTKVAYFDLENGTNESMERLLRIRFELPKDFFTEYNESRNDDVEAMLEEFENFIYYSHEDLEQYGYREKGHQVVLEMMRQLAVSGTQVFLIDPLQAFETQVDYKNALNEQGLIIEAMKNIAQQFKVSVIICHHIRKSISGGGEFVDSFDDVKDVRYKIPTIDDLRGSGKIADFATDVWGMVRLHSKRDANERGKTMIRVLKSRSGTKGDAYLFMDEETLNFHSKKTGDDRLYNSAFNELQKPIKGLDEPLDM